MSACLSIYPPSTGTVIACLRKLQRWNLTSIFEEYRRFTKHTARVQNEQFIELFDTDLVLVNKENAPGFLRE
jgi:tyrosine-protein phosphatase OCA1